MKYIYTIVIIIILVSCKNDTKQKTYSPDLVMELDTFLINQKGRILDLNSLKFLLDLSPDKTTLILYNNFNHSVDKVDLLKLEVVENYSLSKDGPNGTGEYVSSIQIINDSLFFIKSFDKSAIFNKNGKLSKRIAWNSSKNENNEIFTGYLKSEIICFNEEKIVFGLNFDQHKRSVHLNILSVQSNTFTQHYIDPDSSYSNYILTVDDPSDYSFFDPWVFMSKENDLILITHEFSNEIIVFNSKGVHTKTIRYNPHLTRPKVNFKNDNGIPSIDYLRSVYLDFFEQVSYGPLVWDSMNKKYLRLSASRKFSETTKEGQFFPDVIKTDVYLSLFDSNLNFLDDFHLKNLTSIGGKYFAKDGKLWLTQNFFDELGFIIIDYNTK